MRRMPHCSPVAKKIKTIAVIAALSLTSCDDDEDRFETVDKLRALGVSANPVVGQPSTADNPQTITLTVYAALPPDQTATVSAFIDERSVGIPLPLVVADDADTYQNFAGLRVYSANAVMAIPAGLTIPPEPGFLRARYGIRIASGDEVEKIVGDVLIYPAGSQELAWSAPSANIETPSAGDAVDDGDDVAGSIVNPNQEPIRVGWFTSGGKILNRRAKSTSWASAPSSNETLIMTVRGRNSGGFGFAVVDINGN